MKTNFQTKRQQVADELRTLELRMEFLRGQLAALDDIEGGSVLDKDSSVPTTAKQLLGTPSISIGKAIRQGMIALHEFTKDDVLEWVRSTYPTLKFSDRSWGRPLREMMDQGKVVCLKKNVGNKTPAVYGLKGDKAV
jgi:hypothetical protein